MDVLRGVSAVTAVSLVSLASWVWLVCCHGRFWRTDLRLPPESGPPPADGAWPSVAVVVPARDEAGVLELSLPSLLAQRYPGAARVVLVDDNSSDGTSELARRLGARGGLPLTVTSPGSEPPEGWTGKLWALRHGVELACAEGGGGRAGAPEGASAGAPPEYLLLTDADIAHRPGSLRELAAAAEGGGYDLVSQMARLRVRTGWERLIVPAFVYFFAQLYPFRRSNRPGARTAAAAGGCSLVRRTALEAAGGVAAIRGAVIDDVSLARAVKRGGGRIWLGLADLVDSVRPYPGLGELWRMVSRSAFAQLRHSVLLLVGTVLGLLLVYGWPVAGTVGWALGAFPAAAGWASLAAWALMAGSYVPMLRYYGQPPAAALALPFTALLYLAMTMDSAVQFARGRGAAWKGRTYSTR